MLPRPPGSTLFPYTTLFRSGMDVIAKVLGPERSPIQQALDFGANAVAIPHVESVEHARTVCGYAKFPPLGEDRKSTRLNSSHVAISYAVFCLKKKKRLQQYN